MFNELEVHDSPTTTRTRIFCTHCNLSMLHHAATSLLCMTRSREAPSGQPIGYATSRQTSVGCHPLEAALSQLDVECQTTSHVANINQVWCTYLGRSHSSKPHIDRSKCRRLGKRSSGDMHAQPLLVVLDCAHSAQELIKKSHVLREDDKVKDVYVNRDLTPAEAQTAQLAVAPRQQQQQHQQELTEYNIRCLQMLNRCQDMGHCLLLPLSYAQLVYL